MTNESLLEKVKSSFLKRFDTKPVLSFSPGRINLIGEHTDYNEGFVFPAAINKGIVSGIQKNNAMLCSVYAIDTNEVLEFSLQNMQPIKNGGWKNYVLGVVAEILKRDKTIYNFDLVFAGNIPLGAGLSSSAALENSVVFGLNEVFELGLTKKEMIYISQQAEHNYVGVQCGIMDQYASMFGKEGNALLLDCRNLKATYFSVDFKEYDIVLINTNVKHSLAESAYNERRSVCEAVAKRLEVPVLRDATYEALFAIKEEINQDHYQKALFIIQENERVLKAAIALEKKDYVTFGELLFESHNGLQNQYNVSCTELDFLIDQARQNPDVLGARMMGGGFGGCTINIIKKGTADVFIDTIAPLYHKQFNKTLSRYDIHIAQGTYKIT
ncbi:galactokinase [Aquimarina atlantica]|uniref:Galactokinase n=1 Tax=Aquimarina atlantica TaxID=1317122 RepID=A0A023BYQ7_9FLAO|nr:galactokinase [Aquimarina atlantica]EZH75054.1 galactokinase [Aquimarina atlantica]